MDISRRDALKLFAVATVTLNSSSSMAQGFPNRAIDLVVPYGPGTSTDLTARQISPKLSELLGAPIVIDNRAGSGGIVGTEFTAKAAPDGYTMIYATDQTHATNKATYKKLPYDPITDFVPVTQTVDVPLVLVVPKESSVRSVEDLVNLAKKEPNTLNFASTGIGSAAHLAGELFKAKAQIDITHVPYGSASQVFTELIGGQTGMMFYPYLPLKSHIDAGNLIPLATTGAERPSWMSNVPTMIEAGFPDVQLSAWHAVYAPAGTPDEIVQQVEAAFRDAVNTKEVTALLESTGCVPRVEGSAALKQFTAEEIARRKQIAEQAGLEPI